MWSEDRSFVPGEGHMASEPPTLSSPLPPPDALPGRNATQREEGQAGGGRKVLSICRVRKEEGKVKGYLNKSWWETSVTADSRVKKVTTDLFFSGVLVPKPQQMNAVNSASRKSRV